MKFLALLFSTIFVLGSCSSQQSVALAENPSNDDPCAKYTSIQLPSTMAKNKGYNEEHGFLDVPGGNLFYYLVESPVDSDTKPLVVWLNGGPGSSSLVGLAFENGPFRLSATDAAIKLVPNDHSWHNLANILYLEQPPGTGYSTAENNNYDTNEASVAQHMLEGLKAFYAEHSHYKDRDLYLTGESYAGVYIPWATEAILKDGGFSNLKGIAIGDGEEDALTSWRLMPKFAEDKGLITSDKRTFLEDKIYPFCEAEINARLAGGKFQDDTACWEIKQQILDKSGRKNVYDIRPNTPPYDLTPMKCFYNNADVKQELGVNKEWTTTNSQIFDNLYKDPHVPTTPQLERILINHPDIKMIIYNGDSDLLQHHYSVESWLPGLVWPGQAHFKAKEMADWSNGLGTSKSQDQLTYILVKNSGHLVPHDAPEAAYEILKQLISKN